MRASTIVLSLAVLVLVVTAGWQVASGEWANINFRDELQDMGPMAGADRGVVAPLSDEEMVRAVITKQENTALNSIPIR